MEPLSKQQEALLTRAQIESGTLHSTTAYAALVDLGGALRESDRESDEESILASVGSTLQSLVKLGLLVKSGPGTYNLTEEGFRVAQNLGGVSVRRVTKEAS
jgi:hypothetical protein